LLKGAYLKEESNVPNGFAGIFAGIAEQYFARYGNQADAMAAIAAKNHHNGCANPWAQLRKDLGYEFCRTPSDKNPMVAPPLRRTDCSLVSDGAAAIVLADVDVASGLNKAVHFRASTQVNDFLPMSRRDMTALEGCARAWRGSFEAAGMALEDLDLVETHDCFTIAELMQYEAMGLTALGRGAEAALEGWTRKNGRLPVNASGGLKAKGHPIGATGVSMHALVAMQLCGEAGEMQVPGASIGGVFNMGGAGVANYCSLLEAHH
jgi:acetyl-CoA C-acetyltransferase